MGDHKDDDAERRSTAPDLQILGDQVTLQPSGFVEGPSRPGKKPEEEEQLLKNMARFRSEPLAYVCSRLAS